MSDIEARKVEHIRLAVSGGAEGPLSTWFECVHLVHMALPELSLDDVKTSVEFLGYRLSMPLLISGMTGGTAEARTLNERIGEVAQELGIAVGVGSQRPMLVKRSREVVESYAIVRKKAPDVPVIANIGGAQLKSLKIDDVEFLIESIEADAIAIHLNPAQELVQPGGDRDFRGILDRIAELADSMSVPVIVKEVGNGLSREVVYKLRSVGVRIFDVAGSGGTNWVSIEILRMLRREGGERYRSVALFRTWGIPSAAAVIEARNGAPDSVVIVGGGVRTGLDVAKAIAIGADLASMARPVLVRVLRSREEALRFLRGVRLELSMAMLLTGSRSIDELKRAPVVLTPPLLDWVRQRRLTIIRRGA